MQLPNQHSGASSPRDISRKIVKAARNQPWSMTLLNLAWTAGPVTFLAIQGGYFMGFGKTPPMDAFIYFAGYTLIAGVLAIGLQVFRHAFHLPKLKYEEQLLIDTVEQLFLLHFAVRNAYLSDYPPEDHPVIAGWWSIRSASTDIDVLEETIRAITQDEELARAIRRIEFYRRQGLTDLMRQEYNIHAEKIEQIREELAQKFPQLAEFIRARFRGRVPSMRDGQPRPPGFLERLLTCAESGKPEMATGDDVLALINFTLEMLLGREVLTLYPCFNGHKKLEDAKDEFDRLYAEFRLLRRKRNSMMRALISDVSMKTASVSMYAMHATGDQLLPMLREALEQRENERFGEMRYERIRTINAQLHKTWKKLAEHERFYNRLWQKEGARVQARISDKTFNNRKSSALAIEEHELTLKDAQKVQAAKRIYDLFEDLVIRRTTLTGQMQTDDGLRPLHMDDYKKLAGDMLDILDEYLHIAEPSEQLAIEESREADFGSVEPDLAARTKTDWARISVNEVQEDRTGTSHRLAQSLVRMFNVPLGDATIDYLVEKYGASSEYLEQLQAEGEEARLHHATDALESDLLDLPKWADMKPQGA